MAARFVRDEEVVGSNPATPTAETADQAGTEFSIRLICFCLRVYLSDYRFPRAYDRRSCVQKMPSMTTAPVWITGRICFR